MEQEMPGIKAAFGKRRDTEDHIANYNRYWSHIAAKFLTEWIIKKLLLVLKEMGMA